MARFFYTVLYSVLLPFLLLLLWWRGRVNAGYRRRIGERFGSIPHRPSAGGLWIHAASVGETLAAAPLVRGFQQRHPHIPIIVTTNTPTGSEQVKRLFGERVFHMYLPFDLPMFWHRFLRALQPSLLVIMEMELWPNLLATCEKRRLPVILANARLSQKSADGYARFPALTQPMLNSLSVVAAQNAIDGQRFVELGLPSNRLEVCGSVKFDVTIPADVADQGLLLRQQWGSERRVLALASSHAGEDEQLLDLYPQIQQQCPDCLLLLIPRHPERFEEVTNAVHRRGLSVRRRSQGPANANTQVYVADSMGEMLPLLASADLVLMGGSLIPHGGHNPIEPAALGKATLIGPHHANFIAIVDKLQRANALAVVSDESEALATQLIQYLNDPSLREQMGTAGQHTVNENRGAVERLVTLCARYMSLQ